MTFLWPDLLWTLLVVPLLLMLGLWLLGRRRRRLPAHDGLRLPPANPSRWPLLRRRLPPLLLLTALAVMLLAVARPSAKLTLPSRHQTLVLAIDVSSSMQADDIKPSRLDAARAAARDFIDTLPSTTRVGLVAMSGTASIVMPPTSNRADLHASLDRLELQRGTAVGSAIMMSLKTLFPDIEIDMRRSIPRIIDRSVPPVPGVGDGPREAAADPVEPGSYQPGAVILLSDGQTTIGPDPIESARVIAQRGVRVYTVGLGTTQGVVVKSEGWSMRVRLDEDVLKQIAAITRGAYYVADSDLSLQQVYRELGSRLVFETRQQEVTAVLAAVAAVLMLAAAALSMRWFNRVV